MPIAEDNGVGGVAHRQHHCKGDAHGDRDQSVERVDVQSFRLEEKARECRQIMVCLVLCVLSCRHHLLALSHHHPAEHIVVADPVGQYPLLALPANLESEVPLRSS